MIVGFDPGTTAALAAVDLQGEVVLVRSFRGGLPAAVEILRDAGRPSVVASDKTGCNSVSELASSFGAATYFPPGDLSAREKRELVAGLEAANAHEKDALAAALKAHGHYSCLIDRIRSREQEIFDQLVRGEAAHISQAMEREEEETGQPGGRNFEAERRVEDLKRRLERAEHLLRHKDRQLEGLRERLERQDRPVRRVQFPADVREERRARRRLEGELLEAHGRLSRMEAELDRLRDADDRQEREGLRRRILHMVKEYKERFRK